MEVIDYETSLELQKFAAYIEGYGHIFANLENALVTFLIDEKPQTLPWSQNKERLLHMIKKSSVETNRRQYTRIIISGKIEMQSNTRRVISISKLSFKCTTTDLRTETPAERRDREFSEHCKRLSEQPPIKNVERFIKEAGIESMQRMIH